MLRYRDPQPQVVDNFTYVLNLRPNIYKCWYLNISFSIWFDRQIKQIKNALWSVVIRGIRVKNWGILCWPNVSQWCQAIIQRLTSVRTQSVHTIAYIFISSLVITLLLSPFLYDSLPELFVSFPSNLDRSCQIYMLLSWLLDLHNHVKSVILPLFLSAQIFFYIKHGDQFFFSIMATSINVLFVLFPLHTNTYVMGPRSLQILYPISAGIDIYKRQILTSKVDPRALRVKGIALSYTSKHSPCNQCWVNARQTHKQTDKFILTNKAHTYIYKRYAYNIRYYITYMHIFYQSCFFISSPSLTFLKIGSIFFS